MPGAAELGWLAKEPFGELVLDALRDARKELDGLMVEGKFTDPGERETAWLAPQGIHVALLDGLHDLEEILLWVADRCQPRPTGASRAAKQALSDAKAGFRIYDGRITGEPGHRLEIAQRTEGVVALYRQVIEKQMIVARELGVDDAIERPGDGADPVALHVPMGQLLGGLESAVARERSQWGGRGELGRL
jgi:hypothetical protein